MAISDDKISGYSHLFIYLISYLLSQSIDCPGSNYDRTRHNVGFMVIDTLARSEGIECRKLEKSAAVGRGEIGGQTVLLVKPVTFMNNSGESVSALAKFYKVSPNPPVILFVHDLTQPVMSCHHGTTPSCTFYPQVPPSRILVISDDLDQPTAGIKLKPKGGHGGHNGLRSIIERMGNTQDFPRIKARKAFIICASFAWKLKAGLMDRMDQLNPK